MSFLSDYGASPPPQAAIRGFGVWPEMIRLGGLVPFISVVNAAQNARNIAIASVTGVTQGAFTCNSATTIVLRGYTTIVGYGNALIDAAGSGNYAFDVRGTTEIRNIGLSCGSGSTINSGLTAPSSATRRLTSVYNFFWEVYNGSTLNFSTFNDYSGLANFSCQSCWLSDGIVANISIVNCALTAQSVENILVALNNGSTASGGSGTINLSGGTSSGASALTTAAAAARTSLISKGYTITLNP